jgi:hypothetical protein
LEIKNVSLFFIGLIVLIIGIFIVIFDYPQIQYFENLQSEIYLDEESKNIHQRLQIEFSIGLLFTVIGILILIFSFVQKTAGKN